MGASPKAAKAEARLLHYRDLEAFLPKTLQGYRQGTLHASIGKYGDVAVSEAEQDYEDADGADLSIRIVDTSLVTSLRPAIHAASVDAHKLSREDPVGPLDLPMSEGFVRYEPDDLTAEVNLLVGDRFVVAVTSKGASGTGAVRRAAERLDLAGLAKLR